MSRPDVGDPRDHRRFEFREMLFEADRRAPRTGYRARGNKAGL